MRILFAVAALFAAVVVQPAYASQFCDGFKRGYVVGYKRAAQTGFDPFQPFCPFQPIKRLSDPQSDFEHGYLIGLDAGAKSGADKVRR